MWSALGGVNRVEVDIATIPASKVLRSLLRLTVLAHSLTRTSGRGRTHRSSQLLTRWVSLTRDYFVGFHWSHCISWLSGHASRAAIDETSNEERRTEKA